MVYFVFNILSFLITKNCLDGFPLTENDPSPIKNALFVFREIVWEASQHAVENSVVSSLGK